MPFIEAKDHTSLYYRSWGEGKPVVFLSAWAFSGAMWEYQMTTLSEKGLRCIALDRRGHGRSDDPGRNYDIETLADDVSSLLTRLDLHEVTLVGNSMGCGEIMRYLTRYGTDRIARVALVSGIVPCMFQADDNPMGVPREAHEFNLAMLHQDRPLYMSEGAIPYFGLGSTWPAPPLLSQPMVQWAVRLILECSPKATIECLRAGWENDFRPDLASCTVPTLILHGDNDHVAPLDLCGRVAANGIAGSELKIYPGGGHGMFLTHRERLNEDLLAFIHSAR